MPGAALGFAPAGQPLATATCTVGIRCLSTGLMTGCGPTVSGGDATGPTLVSPGIAWTDSAAATAAAGERAVGGRDIGAPGERRGGLAAIDVPAPPIRPACAASRSRCG